MKFLTRPMRRCLRIFILMPLAIVAYIGLYLIFNGEKNHHSLGWELEGSGKNSKYFRHFLVDPDAEDETKKDIKEGMLKMLESPFMNDDTEHGESDMISMPVHQARNPYDFPDAQECGDIGIWELYAAFHNRVVSGKEKGKYLRYNCVSQYSCGGWGNRLGGISVAFTLAVITKRVLVISMPLPLDINILMHPKAIMWNHSISHHLSTRKYFMVDPPALNRQWPSFERMLMSNNSVDVMELQTNLGFFWFTQKFSEKLKQLFQEFFTITITQDYKMLYGCIQRYLFSYDKLITDAVQKEISDLGLQPGKFVAAHYRTQLIANDTEPPTPLDPEPHLLCATMAAEALGHKLNLKYVPVYLITDTPIVEDFTHKFYKGKILTSPVEKIHIDRTWLTGRDALSGYIGVFVNIEVATQAAVFLRFGRQHSSMADLIVSLRRNITTVVQCGRDYHQCHYNTSVCKQI